MVGLAILLSACSPTPVPLEAVLSLDGLALPYVEVTALPFDADALLDSLERASPDPRPRFPALEAAMYAFRPTPAADLGAAGRAWAATRDSAQRLADSLRTAGPEAPGYRAAYRRFQALYRRLTERSARRDAALRDLTDETRTLAARAGAAADSLRRWESVVHAPFDSLAALRLAREGREPVPGASDEAGTAHLELAPGWWWIRATVRHPENPFLEYAWNVPVVVRGYWPLRMRVFERNVRVGWRH